jgi:hypothetical protein
MTMKCPCVHEEPQGIRPGPDAPIRMEANPTCELCGGEGTITAQQEYDDCLDSEWSDAAEWEDQQQMETGASRCPPRE